MRALPLRRVRADAERRHALLQRLRDAHARVERRVGVLEDDLHVLAPRPQRAAARAASSSTPSNQTAPEVGSTSRRMPLPTVVLPQPDSPTSPSVLPARDRERHAVDRLHVRDDALEHALVDREVDLEVLHLKEWPRDPKDDVMTADAIDLSRSALPLPSAFRLPPSAFIFSPGAKRWQRALLPAARVVQRRRRLPAQVPREIAALGEAAGP